MGLPNVFIPRQNGQLKLTIPSEDAVVCMVLGGTNTRLAYYTPKQIFGMDGLDALGITATTDPLVYTDIQAFYNKAGEGAELNFMIVNETTDTLTDMCDKALPTMGRRLLDFTQGRAVVFIANTTKKSGTASNGLDQDVWNALTKLNAMALAYDNDNIPFVGVIPGLGFTKEAIAALPVRTTLTSDYIAINLACDTSNGHISMGTLAGRIAELQVHRSIARVKNGSVTSAGFFPDGTPAIELKNSWGAIHDKGYIFYRKIGQKSGFFYNDDPTATTPASDYSSISWNRVINKAKRIAYAVLIEKLNDDVDTDASTGKIESSVASDWESDVETAIRNSMMKVGGTKVKEISGVQCFVSADSDILNNQIDATLNVVRKGQAKTITLKIGYVASLGGA